MFIVAALLAFIFSDGKLPVEKICCLRGKTRDKYVCHGRMISLNAEMARVANAQRGNFVCEHHWHMLRTTNNICSCPLLSHSRTLSPTPIPARLFKYSTKWGKAYRRIDQERVGAPVAAETLTRNFPPWLNIKRQASGKR